MDFDLVSFDENISKFSCVSDYEIKSLRKKSVIINFFNMGIAVSDLYAISDFLIEFFKPYRVYLMKMVSDRRILIEFDLGGDDE